MHDEDNDATISCVSDVCGKYGKTTFFIEMNIDVSHFFNNVNLYFCNTNPKVMYSDNNGSVFQNTDNGNVRVFRKGILAHFDDTKKALFHYNLPQMEINESRVVRNMSQVTVYGAQLLKGCTDRELIENLIISLSGGNSGLLEHTFYFEGWHSFSKAWLEACKDKKFAPVEYLEMFDDSETKGAYLLSVNILKPLKAQFPELNVLGLGSKTESVYIESKPSQVLIDKVIDSISKLKNTRYGFRMDDMDINYVKFVDEKQLGLAENGKIYLSTKLDCEDVNFISKVIIEENEHNRSGLGDKTRAFQNHLFSLYYDELIS